MASASWSKETDKKVNYTKLCRLLVDGGTQAVHSVFDGIHPPSSLKATLNANKTTLQKLKKPKGKVLNNEQWDQLYPASGSNPKSEDFDITLLFVLLRNICGLTPPATGWDVLPPLTDTSREANLARIKYYRNNTIAHKPNTEINNADFQQHWQDISSALLSLGLSLGDIDDLKSAPLGKKDYDQLLHNWYISDKDIKTQLEEVKSDTADIKTDTADIKTDTKDIKSDTAFMKEKLDNIEQVCIPSHKMDHQIQKLAFSDFRSEIYAKCKSFHPNTRQWILDQVKSHVDSDQPESCIMLITAGPGMGKSTLAAKICQTYKDLGRLAGCHFFQFSNSTRNNPRLMLQSIARQMCDIVPGYREALERKLQTNLGQSTDNLSCEELLTILLEEPLCNVEQPNSNLVIVIDALDECFHDSKNKLLKALNNKRTYFPSWLRFILTSRPTPNISELGSTVAVQINPEDQANIKDLELFFSIELKALKPPCDNEDTADLVQKLVRMTKSLFLVAFFVIDYLKRENVVSSDTILEQFPNGISSVYENYFSRLNKLLLPYISEEEGFYKMLEAVVATNNPLPKNMLYSILCLKSERGVQRQERNKRKDALNALHWLFPIERDHVTAFHKSVIDWLTLQEDQEHDFSVRVQDGDEVLASQSSDVLSDICNGKKDLNKPLNLTDGEKYALGFLCHLVKKGSLHIETDKYRFLSNIYLQAALHIENTNFSNDIRDLEGATSSYFLHALRNLVSLFRTFKRHDPSCHFFRAPQFGWYVALVFQVALAHSNGVGELTPETLDAFKMHLFPYFDTEILLRTNSFGMATISPPWPPLHRFKCKEVIIAVPPISCTESLSTTVYVFELDGCIIAEKFFPDRKRQWLIATCPNINFIVAAKEFENKIEILDATTLKVVSRYESPHDATKTCHVFGDDQGWFIVIKGQHDNKVYVIEGLTGRVRNTITVSEDSTVMDVSCQGHVIVITRTMYGSQITLYHYAHGRQTIVCRSTEEDSCGCSYISTARHRDEAVQFSEDGHLLAYHYKDSILIVNTSDGSLFKRWPLGIIPGRWLDILFVSRSYLMITEGRLMSVINVQTDEVQHRIYVPEVSLSNNKQYLVIPKEDGKSFNLIAEHSDWNRRSFKVSRLVFHNLNLQNLR